MTMAEMHGKLSSSGFNADERCEDLLTSNVFGAFRYLPAERGIVPFLNRVLEDNASSVRIPLPGNGGAPIAEYHFWPTGAHLGREPDVLVLVQSDMDQYAFVFEAKYLSGASDIDRSDSESDNGGEASLYGLQLADQYEDLMRDPPYRGIVSAFRASHGNRFLVYITSHASRPYDVIERSRSQLDKRIACGRFDHDAEKIGQHLLWANWEDVWKFLSETSFKEFPFDLIADDLEKLLERKGFKAFAGFGPLDFESPDEGAFWEERWFESQTEWVASGTAGFFYEGY